MILLLMFTLVAVTEMISITPTWTYIAIIFGILVESWKLIIKQIREQEKEIKNYE